MAVRASASLVVVCADCGDRFELSVRRARELRRLGKSPCCPGCRGGGGRPTPAAIEQAKRYWLARYPLEELQAWPPL